MDRKEAFPKDARASLPSQPSGAHRPSHRMLKRPQFPIARRRTLLIQSDIIAILVSVFVALWLTAYTAHQQLSAQLTPAHISWFLLFPFAWFILAHVSDYYSFRVAGHLISSLIRLLWITLAMLVISLIMLASFLYGSLSSWFTIYYICSSSALTGLLRIVRILLMSWSGYRRRTLIVGTGSAAQIIWHAIKEEAARDYEVVGYVTSIHDHAPHEAYPAVLGTGADLPSIAQSYNIAELIVAYVNEVPEDIFQGLMECYGQGLEIVPMPALYEEITGRIPIELVGEHLWALVLPFGKHALISLFYPALKRLIDFIFSLIGLLLFVPALPFVALAIKLDSPGPVFFLQDRVGRGGRIFKIIKFRSMIDDAENLTGPCWATAYDERVTRIGRIMRKTRIDEVPQLINVLFGQMSLVGPRPERPEFDHILANNIPFYRTRLVVKPGLTGWAQVRYRYGNSLQDALRKLQYDLYYVRHQSPLFDLIIAVKTIGTIIRFQGT